MSCEKCGDQVGAQPFETHLQDLSMYPQKRQHLVKLCGLCAGRLCQELIRYLKGRKQESEALRKR